MIEKLKTLLWFAKRPGFYPHALELAFRKFKTNYEGPDLRKQATHWAANRALPVSDALKKIGLLEDGQKLPVLDTSLINEANKKAEQSKVLMGGPGDLDLIYSAVKLSGAKKVVETGVAFG